MNTDCTKEEFLILAMLYVANVDGRIQPDELRVILDRFEPASVAEVRRRFGKMNDSALIHCIEENKSKFLSTEEDKAHLLEDMHRIVDADDRHLAIEEYILQAVESLLA